MSGIKFSGQEADLMSEIVRLRAENEALRGLLAEAMGYTRHPDYDWDIGFIRDVDAALGEQR